METVFGVLENENDKTHNIFSFIPPIYFLISLTKYCFPFQTQNLLTPSFKIPL